MGAEWTNYKGKDDYIFVNMSDRDRRVSAPDGKPVVVKTYNAAKVAK